MLSRKVHENYRVILLKNGLKSFWNCNMCLIKYSRLPCSLRYTYMCMPRTSFSNLYYRQFIDADHAQSWWHSFKGLWPPVRALKAPAIDVASQGVFGVGGGGVGGEGGRGQKKGSGMFTTHWVSAGPNCCHMNDLCTCDLENRRMEMQKMVSTVTNVDR